MRPRIGGDGHRGPRQYARGGDGGWGRPLLSRPGHEEHNQPLLDAPVHGSAHPRVRGLRRPAAHTQHEVIIRHLHGVALLARAGPQLRVEPDGGGGQRDERVQAVPRAAHGGTRGRGSYF